MSLRIFSGVILLSLTACGGPSDPVAASDPGNQLERGSGPPGEAPAERIACASGDADWAETCTVERTATADGTLVTIRHTDGGFRRLRLSRDGGTVTAADGALPAQVIARGDAGIDIAIGDVRYRLPAMR